jgi:hypothetical protein
MFQAGMNNLFLYKKNRAGGDACKDLKLAENHGLIFS